MVDEVGDVKESPVCAEDVVVTLDQSPAVSKPDYIHTIMLLFYFSILYLYHHSSITYPLQFYIT